MEKRVQITDISDLGIHISSDICLRKIVAVPLIFPISQILLPVLVTYVADCGKATHRTAVISCYYSTKRLSFIDRNPSSDMSNSIVNISVLNKRECHRKLKSLKQKTISLFQRTLRKY